MLSLVVPVYNMEVFLPRCMDTLLFQSSRNFEIILIDDGSVDSSGEICDSYALKYPELIRVIHKENGGLSSARNTGIAAARGEYIVFPDPDDWVEADYVEKFLTLQAKHNADLVCTGYYVDTDKTSLLAKGGQEEIILYGVDGQRALLLPPQMNGFAWNKLYRLDIIREQKLSFLDDVGITEDLDFAYRYLKYCEKICFAPAERTYHYYQREGAATKSGFSPKKIDSLHTYEKIIVDCQESSPELAQAAKDELCTYAVNLIWLYGTSKINDPTVKKILLRHVRTLLPSYLAGSRYGIGRKIQAILAGFFPWLYVYLKNMMRD